MRILIIGASGNIGKVAASALEGRNHEIVRASRSEKNSVDMTDSDSVRELFSSVGAVDAVIVAAGSVPFDSVTRLTPQDYLHAFQSKAIGQIVVVQQALAHVRDGGSITVTTGVTAREPIARGTAAAAVNGALESFVITAAAEAPRGIRVNAVSPNVLANSPSYFSAFVGQRPVPDDEVARAYILAVEGMGNGRTIAI